MSELPNSSAKDDGESAHEMPIRQKIAIFLTGFAAFLPLYAPQSVLPDMAATLGASPTAAGSVIGVTTLAVALAAPAAGPLADRFGRKSAMVWAILLLAPLTLMLSFCSDLSEVLVVRFLQGIALPALFSGVVAYITERWQGHSAAVGMGVYVSGGVMGGFAGRFLAGSSAAFLGWQGSFAVLALVSACCAPMVWRWLPADAGREGGDFRTHMSTMIGHLRDVRIRAACLLGAAVLFALNGTLSYIGFRLAGPPFALSAAGIGLIFCVYPIGSTIVPLNARLLRSLGFRGAALTALAICAVGQLALLTPQLAVTVLGLCIFVTGIFLCQSLALGYVGRSAASGKGAAAGLYVCCFYGGGSLGAVLPGMTWSDTGWTGCVLLVCAALAVGAIASRFMWDDDRRP